MPAEKKKQAKRKRKGFCIFAFGAKKIQGLNRRSIQAALLKIIHDAELDLSYVVVGSVRETEKEIYSICRKNHLPVAVVPADFEKFSINAEYLRNGMALNFFQPSALLLAYASEEEVEEESSARSLVRWAKSHKVPAVICGVKSKKE